MPYSDPIKRAAYHRAYNKKWNIDHNIPLNAFDLANREQFLRAVHYTNLQPMWALENLKKGSKIKIQ